MKPVQPMPVVIAEKRAGRRQTDKDRFILGTIIFGQTKNC
jgi:hypothetical protein